MKYKNFKVVQEIVTEIDKTKEKLNDLSAPNVGVRIVVSGFPIMTIGTWSDCEHECRDFAIKFVGELKVFYEQKIKDLIAKLEAL